MKRHSVTYSRAALRDIHLVANYLEDEVGLRTAERWVSKLRDRIRSLGSSPRIGLAAEEYGPGRRRLIESPYVIVYEIQDNAVEVVRVLHGARDIPSLFPPQKAE